MRPLLLALQMANIVLFMGLYVKDANGLHLLASVCWAVAAGITIAAPRRES